jgi:hypothetical protein
LNWYVAARKDHENIEPLDHATKGYKKVFRFLHEMDRLGKDFFAGVNPTIRTLGLDYF